MFRFLSVLAILILIGGAIAFWGQRSGVANGDVFQAEPATRGNLVATISATGTVEPEDIVDVGAQVAGQIKEFGLDPVNSKPVDYGSHVEAGSILAQIDAALYKARVAQSQSQVRSMERKIESAKAKVESAKAKVESAKANVHRADADLLVARAKQDQSDRDWERARRLGPTKVLSQLDVDTAQAAFETNKSSTTVAVATLAQNHAAVKDAEAFLLDAIAAVGDAEANLANAKAALLQDEINLGYCTIKSPVKGVIIDRRVTLGQTVQSSFNTPSLFLLARDLKRMKVWASVNEADIGQVRIGQHVTFTVDAYPGEHFTGEVVLIRYNAVNTQNVVTYTVEVMTDNANGKLLPYMTANLKFEVGRRIGAVLVPNSALRWQPIQLQVVPEARGKVLSREGNHGVVWVEEDGLVRPVGLELGLSDGNMTEVVKGDLPDGTALVTNDVTPRDGSAEDTKSPFSINLFGDRKKLTP